MSKYFDTKCELEYKGDDVPMKRKLILATNSPRRHEMFQTLNIPFEVRTRSVDETIVMKTSGYRFECTKGTEKMIVQEQ